MKPLIAPLLLLSLINASCSAHRSVGRGSAACATKASCAPKELSARIDLGHWKIAHPREIGYVSLCVTHHKGGDKLTVRDVRQAAPVIRPPDQVRTSRPRLKGGVALISNFTRAGANSMGGYSSTFVRAPSQISLEIGAAPDGTPALAVAYDNRTPGFAGFYTQFFKAKAHPREQVMVDASGLSHLTFHIRGEHGSERLILKMADAALARREDSVALGDLGSYLPAGKITRRWQQARVPLHRLPPKLNRHELAIVTFQVQGTARGQVFINRMAFTDSGRARVPLEKPRPAPRKGPLRRALWLWETDRITHSKAETRALVKFCRDNNITDLFLQIPYQAKQVEERWEINWSPDELRPLLSALHGAGVRVDALDGHPKLATREWHGRMLATIRAVIQYNAGVPKAERFDGVRYDNEPYLLPSFAGVNKQSIIRQFLSSLAQGSALARGAGLSFGADIPFWFDERNKYLEPNAQHEGKPLSESVLDRVDNIAIMDYRTAAYGPDGVVAHAQGELSYAASKGKQVFIGLETVDLPDETIREFGVREGGQRIFISDPQGSHLTVSLEQPPGAPLLTLGEIRKVRVPAAKLTFHKRGRSALDQVIKQTQKELSHLPSFAGFAIHSYESFRHLK